MVMSEDVEKNVESNAEEADTEHDAPELDWENRVLCSDGNCIGVIGPDGRCRECGRPYEGKLPDNIQPAGSDRVPETTEEAPATASGNGPNRALSESSAEESEIPAASSWEDRVLCSDGNCIGVIGSDGRCKECGKPYQPNDEEA